MRSHGAVVAARDDPGLNDTLRGLGVPVEAATCHVAEVDGYVVAGHVPVEAISKLLTERPDGVGLVVPGMPASSPGMGGDPDDWLALDVFLIGTGGELRAFDF
jgi:hypothetical protein